MRKTTNDAEITRMPIFLAKALIFSWIGALTVPTSFTSKAIFPNAVCGPVATIIPFALPCTTTVPIKAIFLWSPNVRFSSFIVEVIFSAGTDSPVSIASSILNSRE